MLRTTTCVAWSFDLLPHDDLASSTTTGCDDLVVLEVVDGNPSRRSGSDDDDDDDDGAIVVVVLEYVLACFDAGVVGFMSGASPSSG